MLVIVPGISILPVGIFIRPAKMNKQHGLVFILVAKERVSILNNHVSSHPHDIIFTCARHICETGKDEQNSRAEL